MKTLAQKMTEIMKTVKTVAKGETVSLGGSRSYTAVGHDDVAALLHGPLAEAGVWVKVSVSDCRVEAIEKLYKDGGKGVEYRADVWVEVTFINAEKPDDREMVKSFAYAFDSSDKATGKAESMAVKYAFLKNFTLESVDEEESREHEKRYAPQARQEPRPAGNEFPASEKQVKMIQDLCTKLGKEVPVINHGKHASDIIARLMQLEQEAKKPAKPTFKI